MDSGVFFGGSVIAATVAGMIALFAPCCISVMLPAFFSSSFQNRGVLIAMTFVFAAGIGVVILPLAMGASLVRQLITGQHEVIYLAAGALMFGLGLFLLGGGHLNLPMPGRRAGTSAGPWSVFTLGVFSGVASSCCAPVLAGVIALSSVASSFVAALTLGIAYVFGMVAPLFVIALLWDRRDWRKSRLFRARTLSFRAFGRERTLSVTNAASGTLLIVMGLATAYVGLFFDAMPSPTGWQYAVALRLQAAGRAVTTALAWVPSWAAASLIVVVVAMLARRALKQVDSGARTAGSVEED